MAAFFAPRYFARPEPNFRVLFRVLDEVDQCSAVQQQQPQQARHHARRAPAFAPRFDLEETETTYELRGELPGVDKEQVEVAFSDPQTIVIRGKTERTSNSGVPAATAAPAIEPEQTTGAAPSTEEPTAATSENDDSIEDSVLIEHEHASEGSSVKSYQATVEDEAEEGKSTTTATAAPETPKPAEQQPAPEHQQQQPAAPKPRYWVSERSIGQFARSFRFPSRVEHEFVTASMDNGILNVSVPKAKKHVSQRISIN